MITTMLVAFGGALAATPQQAGTAPAPAAQHRIELHLSPLADLYFLARERAAISAAAPFAARPALPVALPGFSDAVAAAAALDRALANPLAWGTLDRELESCANADELHAHFLQLPESIEAAGRRIELRQPAAEFADALGVVEARFLDELWPERERVLQAARERLENSLLRHQSECLSDIAGHLGFVASGVSIPVFLVHDVPPFGGITYQREAGGGICFVAVLGAEGTQLDETVLHECTHALDCATPEGTGLVYELRQAMESAGLSPGDARFRNVWHTLFFAEASATVRRRLDAKHRSYGDVAGYYAKVRDAADLVVPRWEAHLRGELDRAALIAELATGAAKLAAPKAAR